MTDTANPVSGSNSWPDYLETLRSNVDVLLLLIVFVVLSYETTSYDEAGLFPLVFLVGGAIFMLVELGSHFLPEPYRQTVRNVLTRRMADVDLTDEEGEGDPEGEDAPIRDVGLVIGMLGVFFVLTYFVNFLAGMVVFTLATGYALGLRDYRLIVVTVLLAIIVYGVFGEIINTPVLE